MPLSLLSLFLLLLSLTPPTHSRRLLHQPLFPIPLPQPPSPPPTISFPKYPSSTNPLQPFFPFYRAPPSPPPPQPSSNLSSLVFPNPQTTPPKHSKPHHVLPILLPLLAAVIILCFVGVFVYRRRRRRSGLAESHTETRRLFSVTSVSGEVPKFAPSASSGPIFSGPAVTATTTTTTDENSNFVGSPYRKLDSPELRPLPPLSRISRHNYVNAEGGGASSDEEFYSPRGSSKVTSGRLSNSGSRMVFEAQMAEKFDFRTSNLSSPSYGSSNSVSSPTPPSSGSSSPRRSSVVKNSVGSGNAGFYPPPRPPPPPPIGPLTPSPPPRRKPHSSSVSPKTQTSEESPNRSPVRNGGFENDSFVIGPPPPPPPPPPVGHWESKISMAMKPPLTNPPVLAPPRHIGSTNPTESAVFASDMKASSDDPDNSTETTPRLKLKPLHWDKVRASSDREMVWDQLRSSSFKVNEEMIETLFVCKPVNSTPKEVGRRPGIPMPRQENRVLDPKKSQNIAILLRALNVTKEEVCEALLEGNTDSLGTELLETLLKMAPNKEEEIKLKEYKDDSPFKLGPAEKFLKAVLDIPFAFKRVEAMLYIANFDSEVNFLRKSFQTLEAACEELRTNRMLMKLLEAVLKTGNRMNVGTNRGDARAFKLDTLLKLVDVKGTDGKTTLLHFVVQEIIRSEGLRLATSEGKNLNHTLENEHEFKRLGLQVVAGLSVDLKNVKKAAAMDSYVLSSYVSKLASGIGKINEIIRQSTTPNSQDGSQKFEKAMNEFSRRAEDEIIKIQAQESVALSVVKEITEYFHGNSAREEAHLFRIFMVVRDFLSSLDQVCKEVGKINDKTGTGRHFPVPVNPTLGPIFPTFQAQRAAVSSDDDYSSSSS